MLLLWHTILPSFLLFSGLTKADTPVFCLTKSSTFEALIFCLDAFTVPHGYYNQAKYDLAQPTTHQRVAWTSTVTALLSVDNNCSSIGVPSSLQGIYDITVFAESGGSESKYCVFHEHQADKDTYVKGWGLVAVPAARAAVSRSIHLSVPHPAYDLGTAEQAASLFKSSGAHSLLVAGRQRGAYLKPSECIIPKSSKTIYYQTDPAHNNLEPFFDASLAIHAWQSSNGGCPAASCAFIQFHGKGSTTCPTDQVFISTGLGHGDKAKQWYTDSIDRPIKRLQMHLRLVFPTWNISMPSDSPCTLTATKNVVGRYFNEVRESKVCEEPAKSLNVQGHFVHIEQDSAVRNESSYVSWTNALKDAFEATCAEGWDMDNISKLCVVNTTGDSISEFHVNPSDVYLQDIASHQFMSLFNILD